VSIQESPRPISTVSIENLGCAKNQVDAEYLISLLTEAGYQYTDSHAEADAIIVNSCGFINPAKEESIAVTLELRAAYPEARVVLAGCLAQRYGSQIELPEADAVVGNRDLRAVLSALEALQQGARPVLVPEGQTGEVERVRLLSGERSAYVKIAEGCDNRCSFCAIPLIRGPVVSRSIEAVVDEVKRLLAAGTFELNLVAQDLASFGRDRKRTDLPELLRRIGGIPGDFWVRLLYIHPDRFPWEIVEIMRKDRRILPYFDIPFQHASEPVLKAMGRRGNAEEYLALIERIRKLLPDAVFRTTILLGFPGEREADRRQIADFLRRGRFLWAGFFIYSPEEDTPAAERASSLSARWSRHRAVRIKPQLEALQSEISRELLQGFIGTEMQFLVEEPVLKEDLAIVRGYLHAPEVDGAAVLHGEALSAGQTLTARITGVNGIDLEAIPVLR
jgi:ribosomal protein S12 methylthiotransferase